ncbi:coronin-6-like [Drosophila miranda]|uniref:coronin-6-like n=1 Tax=Drosophila miranda TaxID=7229 RepID=UPI00143F8823|nr:coronin-6-like [Drosophila miranda]
MEMSLVRMVRNSKFRHVYGQAQKREEGFENIRVSKTSLDSTLCCANPKFLAIILETSGGGAFIVLPLSKTGRIPSDYPLVSGHTSPVLDIAWCPHNDNLIASASEDCSVKLWMIPDEGLMTTLTQPTVDLVYHKRRVALLLWHPSAHNVLLTAGWDKKVVIWNVGTGEILVHLDSHPEVLYSACFNWDGTRLVTTCRDKKIRIFDPRTAKLYSEAICHDSARASRAIFLRSGLVFTTGFNRASDRQYSLRDPQDLSNSISKGNLDMASGVLFPIYDADTNMIYLCGKGDIVIKFFEVTPEPPYVHYISSFKTTEPQRGIAMMPKRGCDIIACEVARFYRLSSNGQCQVVSMTVPRKSDHFQEDLYPNTLAATAAITAEEWIAGMDAEPVTFSLKESIIDVTATNQNSGEKRPRKRAIGGTTCRASDSTISRDRVSRSATMWEKLLNKNKAKQMEKQNAEDARA